VLDPVSSLVFYANAPGIDTVFIDGDLVKYGGKLVGADWPMIRGELRQSRREIERSKKAPFQQTKEGVMAALKTYTGQA